MYLWTDCLHWTIVNYSALYWTIGISVTIVPIIRRINWIVVGAHEGLKLEPQPQVVWALGLLMLKLLPMISSL